ncbi:unnamed protein product [Bursaphelenchus xylophilus]|uniref:(pine wood nematode) hypothetical protein n=1 Tax=Bursaphelenchus xylophilus TaxID=6326 RepID=A0A7I8XFK6_BURXY|nr:unnamed protein product [Bursaphelenchus xylophilus]CAG9112945.1 unnamed protein product [Bursaphelenchus xylophilus]
MKFILLSLALVAIVCSYQISVGLESPYRVHEVRRRQVPIWPKPDPKVPECCACPFETTTAEEPSEDGPTESDSTTEAPVESTTGTDEGMV